MIKITIAAIITLAASLPLMAQTPPPCAPRAVVLAKLAEAYGETRQAVGLAANGTVLEVFANAGEGSWTITVTTPQGQTCLVATGQGYEAIAEALPPQGQPG
jgi:hypothetical protein